jgi:hypothetical protein
MVHKWGYQVDTRFANENVVGEPTPRLGAGVGGRASPGAVGAGSHHDELVNLLAGGLTDLPIACDARN